ncbi:related to integral membrane protein PTH11 [Fusarium torulosum]|uniref:Related to integral membrane protein PTH11 n=1 Tax=Fusarium torulosum TaxID=33205 RepID=A0AAE8M1K9_9HYPO|nr:related to integral membrane protein PTH11 [Fusarium torulosum]
MPATPFQTEAWTEYGLGALVLFLRYFARWKSVGFKGYQGDDYFALAAMVFWTSELVMLELIGQSGTNIGVTDEMGADMSAAEIAKREFGSKCLLAGWNFYVTLIFTLKGVMLCFYSRMTLGLWQRKLVIWTQVGTVLAYLGVIAAIWGHCTPIHKNWQVYPNPGESCTLAVANYLTLVVFNIVTDILIVSIPIPLLWTVKLSVQRKLMIGVLLCSGVFIMIATLLRCIYSLQDIEGINTSTIWAIRETFVAIIAVNAAAIKPLFSASRWLVSSKGSSRDKGGSSYIHKHSHPLATIGGSGVSGGRSANRHHQKYMSHLDDNSSEEHIVGKPEFVGYSTPEVRAGSTASGQSDGQDGIMVTRTYEVTPGKSTLDV